jgi:hypothetical protein
MDDLPIVFYFTEEFIQEFNLDYQAFYEFMEDVIEESGAPFNYLESNVLLEDQCYIILS